jgi:hypothetical protein
MDSKVSLSFFKNPATWPYPEPNESSSHPISFLHVRPRFPAKNLRSVIIKWSDNIVQCDLVYIYLYMM